jgi:hypothetical protein
LATSRACRPMRAGCTWPGDRPGQPPAARHSMSPCQHHPRGERRRDGPHQARTHGDARQDLPTPTAARPNIGAVPRDVPAPRAAQSVGRTGLCLDNAVAEAWFATLKKELGRRHFRHPRAGPQSDLRLGQLPDTRTTTGCTRPAGCAHQPRTNSCLPHHPTSRYRRRRPHSTGDRSSGGKSRWIRIRACWHVSVLHRSSICCGLGGGPRGNIRAGPHRWTRG